MQFINPDSVQRADSKNKTPLEVLDMVRARINKQSQYLRATQDEREKMTRGANLLVKRSNGLNLAIKVANETFKLAPLSGEKDKELASQVDEASAKLDDYKDELFHFYKWVASNVYKKKEDRTPYTPFQGQDV